MALLLIHYRLCHCSCWAQPRPQKRHWALGSALGSVFVSARSSQSPGLDFGLMAWVIVWIRSNYRLRLALNSHRRRRLVAARRGAAMGSRALERMGILSSGHPVAAPPMLEISPLFLFSFGSTNPSQLVNTCKTMLAIAFAYGFAFDFPFPNDVQMNLNLCKWADCSHAAATKSAQAQVISKVETKKKIIKNSGEIK